MLTFVYTTNDNDDNDTDNNEKITWIAQLSLLAVLKKELLAQMLIVTMIKNNCCPNLEIN